MDSKTTFVTVNHIINFFATVIVVNSKTTFVTVNLVFSIIIYIIYNNSKTTFVTVNLEQPLETIKTTDGFKNNLCYC